MKKLLIIFVLTFSILSFGLFPSSVLAARPTTGGGSKPYSATELKGYDISYPQCGKKLPTDHYFGIVGVNGGTASKENPCLAEQLVWANSARAGSKQSKYQLYVNTANPGEVIYLVDTWPTTQYDSNNNLPNNPYGNDCDGSNSSACSWLYGWNRSIYTEGIFKKAAASIKLSIETKEYVWWMDVETMNTWQSGSNEALIRNTAAIEGFAAYYQSKGATVGLYSTAYQWGIITGNNTGLGRNLLGLANWRPSGASLSNAKANCNVDPLTPGGSISLTQYVIKNLDHNHSCL
jgi:hypothetical protein